VAVSLVLPFTLPENTFHHDPKHLIGTLHRVLANRKTRITNRRKENKFTVLPSQGNYVLTYKDNFVD
jgi:hypothetical protein